MRTALLGGAGINGIIAARQAPAIVHMDAYANTLTAILPQLFDAMDVVSRELVGYISAAMRAPSVERAALGQTVSYPIAPAQAAYDITPAMAIPEPPDNTFTTGSMAITKSRAAPFGFTGEEQRALNAPPGGVSYLTAQGMMFAQALRTLTNEVELDLAVEASANVSRWYGTAGTTPFGSGDLTDLAQIQKILDDNGAPQSGRAAILNTSSAARLQTISNLSKVNESGTTMTLRDGQLLDIYGMAIKKTGQSISRVKGTGAAPTTNAAGYAVGARVITLASASTGTILVNDVVMFAGDPNKYHVVAGDADVSNGGTITLAEPGLRQAIPTSATLITVGNNYTVGGTAFSQDALHVAMRPPARPVEGDAAIDVKLLTDPRSGVTFELSIYPGYRKVRGEVALAWGVKASKREHIAGLLG